MRGPAATHALGGELKRLAISGLVLFVAAVTAQLGRQLHGPLPCHPLFLSLWQSNRSPMSTDATGTITPPQDQADPRALTVENVERVLDELRPYLMADGGNVEIVELDGPVVKVRLQGACGSCPSSTMTLKMGIERKLRESIPEVTEVVQVL